MKQQQKKKQTNKNKKGRKTETKQFFTFMTARKTALIELLWLNPIIIENLLLFITLPALGKAREAIKRLSP